MGKRKGDESNQERIERKRLKKEYKKKKKEHKKERRKVSTSAEPVTEVFVRKKLTLSFSLLPSALGDIQKSIEESMRLMLLKYSDGIEGILLAFENVKILSKAGKHTAGMILNELPHIHYRASTDALVFSPAPGCQLSGVITESFHSHVSLVVHHYFNASVSAEQMVNAGFEFDDVQIQWYWKDTTSMLANGDAIDFECQKIYESGGHISMYGSKPSLPVKKEA